MLLDASDWDEPIPGLVSVWEAYVGCHQGFVTFVAGLCHRSYTNNLYSIPHHLASQLAEELASDEYRFIWSG